MLSVPVDLVEYLLHPAIHQRRYRRPCGAGRSPHGDLLLSPDQSAGSARTERLGRIPGARGCTPQAFTFRDHHHKLAVLGAEVFGLSTQSTAYQVEMAERLHLPFAVLSDEHFGFTEARGLPTFETGGTRLLKRLTLVVSGDRIDAVFYPVTAPERRAETVPAWLRAHPPPTP